jgi:hypothetical protein
MTRTAHVCAIRRVAAVRAGHGCDRSDPGDVLGDLMRTTIRSALSLALFTLVVSGSADAQHRANELTSAVPAPNGVVGGGWTGGNVSSAPPRLLPVPAPTAQAVCDYSEVPGVIWWGPARRMSLERLASYAAPVYWFSPDEPSLERREGPDIRIPEIIPGEPVVDKPVVYYQFDEILVRTDGDGPGYLPGPGGQGTGNVDLHNVAAITLGMFAYFADEVGLGAHPHDLEATSFKVVVARDTARALRAYSATCSELNYVIAITRSTAKAHGLQWFWNVVETDEFTDFPMHLLVEEGKHGIATDKNGDGYFTPGYDVNVRINDAWGVRDNMATGLMATGKFESWMAKVRRPEHRVIPPLPDDSPLKADFERKLGDVENAVYELRPLPPADIAGDDEGLHHIIAGHAIPGWPEIGELSSLSAWQDFVDEGTALKSLSIAFRADGDLGFSFVFPFFVVKHLTDAMTGGYIVHRMYLKDENLRDFGWMLLYTPSASRWMDTYLAAGAERDREVDSLGVSTDEWDFVFETGLKFRVNMAHTPLKFLTVFTDYWGFRAGIKNRGFWSIDDLTYVFEVGAGSF